MRSEKRTFSYGFELGEKLLQFPDGPSVFVRVEPTNANRHRRGFVCADCEDVDVIAKSIEPDCVAENTATERKNE